MKPVVADPKKLPTGFILDPESQVVAPQCTWHFLEHFYHICWGWDYYKIHLPSSLAVVISATSGIQKDERQHKASS